MDYVSELFTAASAQQLTDQASIVEGRSAAVTLEAYLSGPESAGLVPASASLARVPDHPAIREMHDILGDGAALDRSDLGRLRTLYVEAEGMRDVAISSLSPAQLSTWVEGIQNAYAFGREGPGYRLAEGQLIMFGDLGAANKMRIAEEIAETSVGSKLALRDYSRVLASTLNGADRDAMIAQYSRNIGDNPALAPALAALIATGDWASERSQADFNRVVELAGVENVAEIIAHSGYGYGSPLPRQTHILLAMAAQYEGDASLNQNPDLSPTEATARARGVLALAGFRLSSYITGLSGDGPVQNMAAEAFRLGSVIVQTDPIGILTQLDRQLDSYTDVIGEAISGEIERGRSETAGLMVKAVLDTRGTQDPFDWVEQDTDPSGAGVRYGNARALNYIVNAIQEGYERSGAAQDAQANSLKTLVSTITGASGVAGAWAGLFGPVAEGVIHTSIDEHLEQVKNGHQSAADAFREMATPRNVYNEKYDRRDDVSDVLYDGWGDGTGNR